MRCSAKKRGRAIRSDHESELTGFGSTAINAMLCEKMVLLARCEILERRRASSTAIKAAKFRGRPYQAGVRNFYVSTCSCKDASRGGRVVLELCLEEECGKTWEKRRDRK